MEFSRVGKHTINCLITEDEIQNLGFSVDEIVTNTERTQQFMNQIFDLAEREFETKFDMGVKTVQVEFRSDHTLSLTFSEHPAAEGMMEHLKEILGSLLSAIPQEKLQEYHNRQLTDQSEKELTVLLQFSDMESVIRFAKNVQVEELPEAYLCKEKDTYYLMIELHGYPEEEVKRLSILTDEYAQEVDMAERRWSHLREHGKMILSGSALEYLRQL